MNDEPDYLKRNILLLQLAQSYGMQFKRVGRTEYQSRCPDPTEIHTKSHPARLSTLPGFEEYQE